MKRTKAYIEAEQAKKKVDRYSFWSIKDEAGILICSKEENNPDNESFQTVLDRLIADNVDAEVQVRFGSNEQSARNNQPFFIRINEDIEWVEPEEETVTINGKPHKVDKNGNVNINFPAPERQQEPTVEPVRIDTVRQEMEYQLDGIKKEYDLHRERMKMETENRLSEQMLKFERMLLNNRMEQLAEREQQIAQKEADLSNKESEVQESLKGYLKQIPNALGGLLKEWTKNSEGNKELAGTQEEEKPKPSKERTPVAFTIKEKVTPTQLPEKMEVEKELEEQELEFEQQEGFEETQAQEETNENDKTDDHEI